MIPQFLSLLISFLLLGPGALARSVLRDTRHTIVVDISRCPNPKAVQPNIQTIESHPSFDTSLCGLRDSSPECDKAAEGQISMRSSKDGKEWTFHVPRNVYDDITVFVWLQEQDQPEYWDDPVQSVGGTVVTLRDEGTTEATVRAKGKCPDGETCHEPLGFVISSVYFQSRPKGGVIGFDRAGVARTDDPYERLIIQYCGY